jgi:hypothetical protein
MNTSTFLFTGTMVLTWILVVFTLCLIPFYTRKNIAFGVSVPESEYHSEFLTELRRRYLIVLLIGGIILGAGSSLSQVWFNMTISSWIQITSILFYLLLAAVMYLLSYFKVRQY